MKILQYMYLAAFGAVTANAYMCNCFNVNRPEIVAAAHVYEVLGGALCSDKARNINGCIIGHTNTDADCARLYFKIEDGKKVPDTSFKANCEHYTVSYPS
ncbi:hypothetical protein CGCA056_v011710 [Colletotrichum aenigma]|uniref:uncharacterized protein n=1 Tax=Colletotrichum aenigma TaxID=1215731 RepID=UPI0018724BF2|nr:uncharacterized protein CGCA056_v011710 [Colletotrichum aenigma]KAF5512676.1 hypothetical protein CGCA056_v011710 [Colletotrichum aenigma]